ncbi:phosphatidate cytidylyltransferase [Penicillium odoratum]|uniref:phosphatidate cytidylyltransferase n=1 Tax=Penicillium odoratum TaxID=1167516 RepID=UPI0025493E9E|nr:phosphatidate cytidylyltransferase [Penicillium odoratum]KAJ5745239.1 phosphatidate cytidylyltransferase [Penicillium odoratum]
MAKPKQNVASRKGNAPASFSPNKNEKTVSELTTEAEETPEQSDSEKKQQDWEKKRQTFITRTIWTFVMIAGFFIAMFSGHIYIIGLVTAIQIVSFKEVINIANKKPQEEKEQKPAPRFTKQLSWYFLATTMYFLYGESVIYYFKHILLVDKVLLPLANHHRFISFTLYVMGFVFFVGSLRKDTYKLQFVHFAWTHMALYLIVVQAHFVMNNIFEGMIWFFLPASLVITNDIFAYVCGITFGRTQLIKLSPKKTVEGFLGAWICTIIFGYFMTNILMRYKYFICPVNDLGSNVLTGLECVPNSAFIPQPYSLEMIGLDKTFYIEPMQLHILSFATFASLIAPFGGFFASGLKRSFQIKDFGESIPGHGGITDRMDCQFIMGFFAYMYYHSFIAVYKANVGDIIETVINGLTVDEQFEVVRGLSKYLHNQGVVSDTILDCLVTELKR